MRKISVGVIGCGAIAQIMHLPFLKELPQFEIGAICDISPKMVLAVGDQYGVQRRFSDYRQLLNLSDLDAVLIATQEHAQIAIDAANAGKHILVEKPMTFNLEEADAVIAAAAANRVKLMIGYMKCYDPGFERALQEFKAIKGMRLIRMHDFSGSSRVNDEIYDLHKADDLPAEAVEASRARMNRSMIQAIGEDRAHLVGAYGQLLGLCSHDASILRRAFGDPERVLYADVYDGEFVVAVLQYANDVRCVWEAGTIADRKGWDEQLVAYGNNRIVEVRFPFPYLRYEATLVNVREMDGGAVVDRQVLASYDEAFKREWRHFHTCITEDREPITSGAQGRADLELLIDIIKTARLG